MKIAFCSLAFAAVAAGACVESHAQAYPSKPVRLIIPFPPGGPTDIIGRMAADILTKALGVQFVADNRAGAGGNIGTEQCAKSPPDGYTVCMMTVAQSISPAIYRKLGFDPGEGFRARDADGAASEHADGSSRASGEKCERRSSRSRKRSPANYRMRRRGTARARTC